MAGAFYRATASPGVFTSTELTRGPWDVRFQHGGPPSALLAGAMAAHGDTAAGFVLARLTAELLRPVPIADLRVEVAFVRRGRMVERLRSRLLAGDREVMTATGLRIRRTSLPLPPQPALTPWPAPDTLAAFEFPFFQHDVGYHTAVDIRIAAGAWGATPIRCWARSRVPLVAGRAITPLEQLVVLADAQSGMGVPLDPSSYSFVNPDLTVYLERPLVPGWIGLDIRSVASVTGMGLSQSALRDAQGLVGRSAQSLAVAPR